MSELIKITNHKGQNLVNARELHQYLNINSKFSDWIKNRIEKYGFMDKQDYLSFSKILETGGKTKEYGITTDMAKELCMVENNEQGRIARRYFIQKEKEANSAIQLPDFSNPAIAARAWADQVEAKMIAEARVNQLAPKAELADTIIAGKEIIDIGMAAKILQLPYGRNTMFKNLRNNGVFFKNRNEPKQQYITQGYFKLKEVIINRDNHDPLIKLKVLVTQKGLAWLHKSLSVNNETPKHITFD